MPTAAFLLYDGCNIAEVAELASRLSNEDVDLHWVSPDGSPIVDHSGLTLVPACSIAELQAVELDVLVVPGGDPAQLMGDDIVRALVRRIADHGITAGICAGVLVLADAGVLASRRATHNYRAPWAPPEAAAFVAELFDGATVEEDQSVGVVIDENVITALPNATAEFSLTVCRLLGIYDNERASLLVRHLQGKFVLELFHRP